MTHYYMQMHKLATWTKCSKYLKLLQHEAITKEWWHNSFISSQFHLLWRQLIKLSTGTSDISWQLCINVTWTTAVDCIQFDATRQCFGNQSRTVKHHQILLPASRCWRRNVHYFTAEHSTTHNTFRIFSYKPTLLFLSNAISHCLLADTRSRLEDHGLFSMIYS